MAQLRDHQSAPPTTAPKSPHLLVDDGTLTQSGTLDPDQLPPAVDANTQLTSTTQQNPIGRNGRTIKNPRVPTKSEAKRNTAFREQYCPYKGNVAIAYSDKFKDMADYDKYPLVSNPNINKESFKSTILVPRGPEAGVCLDDRARGIAIKEFTARERHRYWPADFDQEGMVRARCMPVGFPCVVDVKEGDLDVDGNPCTEPREYYGWQDGIHCLMGDEGYQAGLYMVRPSHEKPKCKGIGWKVGWKVIK